MSTEDRPVESKSGSDFAERIEQMNAMYRLPINQFPREAFSCIEQLTNFKKTLSDEVDECDDIVNYTAAGHDPIDIAVMIADWLGDLVVYARSEALKLGIPLEEVLSIIMDSNASKLGADGQPIYNEQGKFLKGPNYWKPEPKIRELLEKRMQLPSAWDDARPGF